MQAIAISMSAFVGGVASAGLTFAIRYVSQVFYRFDWDRTGITFNVLALVFGLGSLVLFCWGGYLAYKAIIG